MPIRVKCPRCEKVLTAKDHLAGKKVHCPVCKGPIVIPAPTAAPADIEAFAAAALADDPTPRAAAAAAPAPTGTIDFTCDFCDAELHLPVELAGKKAPCPECKRILNVPKLKEEKPKDWRQVQTSGPAFARRDEPERPAGAWDTRATRVSTEALEEAGAIPEVVEPPPRGQRVKRILWAVAGVAVAVGAYVAITGYFSASARDRALTEALAYVEPTPKVGAATAAEVFRGAGEFYTAQRQAARARDYFAKARDAARKPPEEPKITTAERERREMERDLFLIDLAVSQAGMGGSGRDLEGKERLEWDDVYNELVPTLNAIGSMEVRQLGMRTLARRLVALGQPDLAFAVAKRIKGEGTNNPLVAQQVALLLEQSRKAPDDFPPQPNKGEPVDAVTRLAYAEGAALQGKFPEARQEATRGGPAPERLEALLAVATAALAKYPDEARETLRQAVETAAEAGKEVRVSPVLKMELARLLARAGMVDEARAAADALEHKACQPTARLALVEAGLRGDRSPVDFKVVADTVQDREALAYALALARVARHNARHGGRGAVSDEAARQEERFRPLMHVGLALGIQDATQ